MDEIINRGKGGAVMDSLYVGQDIFAINWNLNSRLGLKFMGTNAMRLILE